MDTTLALMRGDSLARESTGTLLVSAFGFFGEGVFRIDPSVGPPTYTQVSPLLATDSYTDLAVEGSGDIVAVGERITPGELGVFRVVASGGSTGTTTAISLDPAWVSPVAIAVSSNGDLFVGDEGTCANGVCTGASVVRVDPVSGARLDVWTGGSITGPTDLLLVTSLPACQDGIDNDSDGATDYPAEIGCRAPWDPSEELDCQDGIDNDSDGAIDFPADATCQFATSAIENPQCGDGIDNDSDGLIDVADLNCPNVFVNAELKKKGCGLFGIEALPILGLLTWRRRRSASNARS